jgi:hypothetical protein
MSVDGSSGNVGIGTTTPATKLQVLGAASDPTTGATKDAVLRLTTTASNALNFGCSASSPFGCWIQAQENAGGATTYPLLLNPVGGNVGIGTTTPGQKLVIDSGSNGNSIQSGFTGGGVGRPYWTYDFQQQGARWTSGFDLGGSSNNFSIRDADAARNVLRLRTVHLRICCI